MIVLAALLVAHLAPGCRQLERSIRCELAPPVGVPAAPPPPPREVDARSLPRPRHRSVARPPKPAASHSPPTQAGIAHHLELLVAIADCTGARTLLRSVGSATADSTYQACIGNPVAPSGRDLGAVPGEAATARSGSETIEHPQ